MTDQLFDVRNAVAGATGDLDNIADLMLHLAESGPVSRETMYAVLKAIGAIRDDLGKAEATLEAMAQQTALTSIEGRLNSGAETVRTETTLKAA